jgi:maltose/moltooligosaccharide transporter
VQSDNALLLGALVGALPAFITMTIGPVVGAWSDRTRTRWGRRIPFLLGTAPFIGAGMAGLAFCDEVGAWLNHAAGGEASDLKLAIIVTLGVCWTLFEVATIIGNALFTALINDTVPKVMIGRFFGIFRIFSLAVGAYFYFFVFTNDIMKIHQEVLIAIGAVYVVGFGVLCAFVKEGEYPPAPPRSTEGVVTNVGRYFHRCFANRFYLLLFAVFGLASTAIYVFNVNAFPAKDQFGLDKTGYGQALAVTYIISMTLAFPIGWLTDRFTPVLLGLITVALYTLVMVGAYFGINDPLTFQFYFVAHGVLSGAFYTCTAAGDAAPWPLLRVRLGVGRPDGSPPGGLLLGGRPGHRHDHAFHR